MANIVQGGWRNCKDAKWARPPAPADWDTQDIVFQMLEVDSWRAQARPGLSGTGSGEVTIVRLFGVTAAGNSVLVHCHGFMPYFWVQAPASATPAHLPGLREHLNRQLHGFTKGQDAIVDIQLSYRSTLQNYQFGRTAPFFRVTAQMPLYVPRIRGLFEKGIVYPQLWQGMQAFLTYESNIVFELRFMIDNNLSGSGWVRVASGDYRRSQPALSHCQVEVEIHHSKLQALPSEGEHMQIAPYRIMSFDIECEGRDGAFPQPQHDPVIQIANHVVVYGRTPPLIIKNIFCLQSCSNIVGADVYAFETEADLLMAWKEFVLQCDPDVLTGYNIINFDLPYLIDRAEALKLQQWPFLGRIHHSRVKVKDAHFQSKAHGQREYKDITIEGRLQLDVLVVVQREHKLRSYSLNAVATHFLEEQKEAVHHSIIATLQRGDEETRRRLAVYCLKDAYLPVKLIEKLQIVVNLIEMARVTGVTVNFLMTRGQQIKVYSQILRKTLKGLLFPTYEYQGATGEGVGYEGATVIEPKRGIYYAPIATLDFASLYPSIMMAHNLCYSTLVPKSDVAKLSPDQYTRTPSGDCFVKREVFRGLLPEILEELLDARKKAKKLMAQCDDPMKKAVYNGRQLALKISANSVYGFTGATVGKLPCLEISASVTSFGRLMIDQTKAMVESHFNKANGYDFDAAVIYGDTDSVMVKFGYDDIPNSMRLGKEAAALVSRSFIAPIKLEFEKVYCPYLLMNKKRYAGLLYTKPERHDYLDAKGIESVRRDNCPLVKNMVQSILHKMLIERSVPQAVEYAKQTISDLLMNRLDISHLVITKSLSKSGEEYAAKQAHVELVERMRKRDPASAPAVGDRVPYVIVKAVKGAKAFEKSEDPIYVLEHNIPVDTQYYLEHHLLQPLERLFDAVLDNPRQVLLQGDHTRSIAIATPSKAIGGIMKFAKITLTCLHCKGALDSSAGHHALCGNCRDKEAVVYARILSRRNHYEKLFSRVWTQCQRCQGSLHMDVLCSSRDCPVFYLRKKVQKDLREQQALLDRFGSLEW